ncbi:MAG: plasmid recombination protein [Verrucomicrobia bacterium]|nr:plasmid recombination protein [Verrucomicrobiota bacterium]
MPFVIYRVAKLKTPSAIRGSIAHNARTRITPNADSSRTPCNRQLFGFEGLIPTSDAFLAKWELVTRDAKRKREAVLVQELFLGASPEFFDESQPGLHRDNLIAEWTRISLEWLREEFGENLLSATLHLDEKTPHVAAYVVPLAPARDGTVWLSGKKLFNPVSLVRQQDAYAKKLSSLGLERGVRGSQAEHRTLKSYYGQVTESVTKESEVNPPKFSAPEKALLESTSDYSKRVSAAANEQLALLSQKATSARLAASAARELQRTVRSQQRTNQKLATDLATTRTSLRELSDLVRDIPLSDVLARLGWGDGEREGSTLIWRTGEHAISVTGAKWYDHKSGKGGGKAIDLAMHVMSCGFADAVGWLAGQWSQVQVAAAVRVAADHYAALAPRKSFTELWTYFAKPDSRATELAREYLVTTRGLSAALIDEQIRAGLLHGSFQRQRDQGPRTWCVFRHLDIQGQTKGATLRALDDLDGPKRALGEKLTAFFAVGPTIVDAEELVFVESPVDALSYYQRSQRARVVSVAGSVVPDCALELARDNQIPVTVALDRDSAGDRGWHHVLERVRGWGAQFAARLRRVVPLLSGWAIKDWNDLLRAETVELSRNRMKPSVVADNDAPLPSVTATRRVIKRG